MWLLCAQRKSRTPDLFDSMKPCRDVSSKTDSLWLIAHQFIDPSRENELDGVASTLLLQPNHMSHTWRREALEIIYMGKSILLLKRCNHPHKE